ncbi:helix-turn-helix domain-containing protein [Microcoleus sp. PH2017_01_SCD_O_A]
MLLSIKTKLKLNKSQATVMSKHAGIARLPEDNSICFRQSW